jgi:hypothetical protein
MLLKVHFVGRPKIDVRVLHQGLDFFMGFLYRGISMGQGGAWFAQPEAQLTEHPLALTNPEGNAVPLLNPRTECFSIPEVPAQHVFVRISRVARKRPWSAS